MNNEISAVNSVSETVSEYKIGNTIYRVTTKFNPTFRESLSDILKRLIIRDCEDFLGEIGQEQDK